MFQFNFICKQMDFYYFYKKHDFYNFTKLIKSNSILLVKMIFNRAMTFYKIIYKNTSIPFLLTKNDLLFDFIKKNIFV